MGAGAFVPLAAFGIIVGSVGWRLLSLWRRSRQTPELLLGLGLLLMSCVAMPLAGLGRVPATVDSLFGKVCFGLGMGTVAVATVLFVAFTQRVFRPDAAWARGLLVAVAVAVTCAASWMSWTNFAGGTLAAIVPRMRPGTLALTGSLLACFAWASCESFIYYANLRRRFALGLADPVLVDRFFLWGVSSGANTLLVGLILYFVQTGTVIMHDPVALIAISLVGSVMSASWYLTFLAPGFYLDYVRKRSARV